MTAAVKLQRLEQCEYSHRVRCERSIMQFRDQTTALTLLKQLRDVNSVRGTKAMVAVGHNYLLGITARPRGNDGHGRRHGRREIPTLVITHDNSDIQFSCGDAET